MADSIKEKVVEAGHKIAETATKAERRTSFRELLAYSKKNADQIGGREGAGHAEGPELEAQDLTSQGAAVAVKHAPARTHSAPARSWRRSL